MSIRDDRRLKALSAIAVVSLVALLVLAAVFIANAKSTKADAPGFVDAQRLSGRSDPCRADAARGRLDGQAVQHESLNGRPYMVTFLYTHCPDVCPLIGAELQGALRELGKEAKKTDVVAVSVDPRGDTRSAVQAWLKVHHEPSNFHYLIGSEAELQPYWDAWHVGPQIAGDPDSSHTAIIYLVNREAKIEAIVGAGSQIPSSHLAHDFRTLIGS